MPIIKDHGITMHPCVPYGFVWRPAVMLLICAVLVSVTQAEARQDTRVIRQILEIQGLEASTRKAIEAQLEQAKRKNPDLPHSTWESVEARINGPELENNLIKVWLSTFSASELKDILAFLKTSAGKKFLQSQQVLQAKSSAVAGLWGMDVYSILQNKHPDKFKSDRNRDQKMRKMFKDVLGDGSN